KALRNVGHAERTWTVHYPGERILRLRRGRELRRSIGPHVMKGCAHDPVRRFLLNGNDLGAIAAEATLRGNVLELIANALRHAENPLRRNTTQRARKRLDSFFDDVCCLALRGLVAPGAVYRATPFWIREHRQTELRQDDVCSDGRVQPYRSRERFPTSPR